MSEHKPCLCERVPNTWHYSTRNHSCQYKCDSCGRTGRFNTNFLGGRKVVCDGVKFHKISNRNLLSCQRCHKTIVSLQDLAIDTGINTLCTDCKPDRSKLIPGPVQPVQLDPLHPESWPKPTYTVPEHQRCRLEDM